MKWTKQRNLVLLFVLLCPEVSLADWPTVAANPERTSWVPDEVRGQLSVDWYLTIDPYVHSNMQVISATVNSQGRLFVSTSRGLYCFAAENGDHLWTYGTELPLGHSPSYANGIVFVGGYDRRVHAIDSSDGALRGGEP